ncbi:hypothetical protein [Collimonas sp. PA-H2]|uniref:hypothetical protein n=1 Tax=Collimonas sp. PA-H2 TaxID=1881062 RepID=UPI000BF68E1B|nr:hypothetical protein [Collimonas sp. PA-H2]
MPNVFSRPSYQNYFRHTKIPENLAAPAFFLLGQHALQPPAATYLQTLTAIYPDPGNVLYPTGGR